jgi:hypothetical protein
VGLAWEPGSARREQKIKEEGVGAQRKPFGGERAVRSQAESERESGEVGCRDAGTSGQGKWLLPVGFRWKSTLPEESGLCLLVDCYGRKPECNLEEMELDIFFFNVNDETTGTLAVLHLPILMHRELAIKHIVLQKIKTKGKAFSLYPEGPENPLRSVGM